MSNQPINNKRIAINTVFLYAKTIITTIISLYSTRIVLSSLGSEDFGVYGIVGGAIAMLGFLNTAMSQATQRFMNYAQGEKDELKLLRVFNNSVLLHIAMGLVIVFLMALLYIPLFNGILNIPADRIKAAELIYLFLIVSTFFTIITVPYDAMINAHEDFLYFSIVGVLESFLKLLAAFALLYFAMDRLILYGALIALIAILMMIAMRIYCKKKYKECVFKPKTYYDVKTIKEIGSFAGWNFVSVFSNIAGNHGSTILMNHYFGAIVIAAKNIGDQVGGQLNVLSRNLTKAMNPVIVKSEGGGDHGSMLRYTMIGCRFGFLLYLVVSVPVILEASGILHWWLKEVPDWAVLFCQLQVVRTLLEQLGTPIDTALMAQNEIKLKSFFDLTISVSVFLSLVCAYYLGASPHWHYFMSILGLVIIITIVKIIICHNKCGLSYSIFFNDVLSRSFSTLLFSALLCIEIHKHLNFNWHIDFIIEFAVVLFIAFLLGIKAKEKKVIFSKFRK